MPEPKWSPGILFLSHYACVLDSPLTRPFRRLLLGSKVEIFRWAGIKEGMEVLELGPGPGYFTIDLARHLKTGALYAVDLQQEMVSKLRRKLERRDVTNVKTYVADAAQLPLENHSVDLVFAYSVLEEVQDLTQVAREIHRVLRPLGVLAIVQVRWDFTQDQKRAMKIIVPTAGFDMIHEVETFLAWKARYMRSEAKKLK